MTTYTCKSERGLVVFTPEAPGQVLNFQLQAGQSLICQKDAFMVAESSVTLEMHFRKKLGAGLFGGEGFVLEKVTGPGQVSWRSPRSAGVCTGSRTGDAGRPASCRAI
jgi:uncharacterized protein (AIM24 family)